MKVYVVTSHLNGQAWTYGIFASEKKANDVAKVMGLSVTTYEVQEPPTWTVWSKPNSVEARSAALNEDHPGDFKVRLQPSGGYIVNVPANDIKEAIDVGESAFRMHQISNQQENSK